MIYNRRRTFEGGTILKRKLKWGIAIILILIIGATVAVTKFFGGETRQTEEAVVEKINNLNELTAAESYTKVVIERENNKIFGQEIGLNIPGTKQKVLVIVPGTVRAGIDLDKITKKDVEVDERKKTIELTLPKPTVQGQAALDLKKVKVFSSEGLFRDEATIKDGFSLAKEAQEQMVKEAMTQGLLETAERNTERSMANMFELVDYKTVVHFKE
ncbi:DUF4230 domain-containing protein [Kurthia zopfii]|nr:DUF4230 domain-containing protein [Kurthia zopfii]